MRVLHINAYDDFGGAGIAAWRLHESLVENGVESKVLCGERRSGSDDVKVIEMNSLAGRLAEIAAAHVTVKTGLQYWFLPSSWRMPGWEIVRRADVVHLHNLHGGFFAFPAIRKLSRVKPVVWTLHDMWPLTGHCSVASYSECARWQTGCGRCPQIEDYPAISRDTSAKLWKKKRSVYRGSRFIAAAPSEWLAARAASSPLMAGKKIVRVPHGLDARIFNPGGGGELRDFLGVGREDFLVFAVAVLHGYDRKGGTLLESALAKVAEKAERKVVLLTAGADYRCAEIPGVRAISLGPVQNERMLAACYSAADLFANPSLGESFSLTTLEAMASGTPVAAFDTTALPELVEHGKTGMLAEAGSVESLAEGVRGMMNDPAAAREMGREAARRAREYYGIDLMRRRYVELYEEAIERFG